jgi:hypothetical protein
VNDLRNRRQIDIPSIASAQAAPLLVEEAIGGFALRQSTE